MNDLSQDTTTGHAAPLTAADTAAERRVEARVLIIVLVALVAWGLSVWIWGVPGLYIPALALVPVIYVVLILVSRG